MGFLDRAIKKGISEGVGKAVGDAINKTIEPKATEFANQAAQKMNQAADNAVNQMNTQTAQKPQGLSNLENAFANLEKAAQGYVTKLSENIKVCPSCGRPCEAAQEFCPECGAELPKETIAQSAVCSNCQKQNPLGTKFCQDCGTKLPIAVQEEQPQRRKTKPLWLSGMQSWEPIQNGIVEVPVFTLRTMAVITDLALNLKITAQPHGMPWYSISRF